MFRTLFLSILLLCSCLDARKVKVGSPPRGGSAARAGSRPQPHVSQGGGGGPPGVYPHQPGGVVHPNQPIGGGVHPGQPGGGYRPGAGQQPGGYHPNQPGGGMHPNQGYGHSGFNSGVGPGSASRGSGFKTALAAGALGAVGGIVTYELGKAIINSATKPFHVNDRPYYFDEKNYEQKKGYSMCSMPLDDLIKITQNATTVAPATTSEPTSSDANVTTTPSPDQVLSNIQYKDGSRPKTVVWGCKTGAEVCCGTECCPAPPQVSSGNEANNQSSGTSYVGIAFGILVAILLLMCCCCCIAYRFFRSCFDVCLPTSKYRDDPNVTYTSDKYVVNPAGSAGYTNQPPQGSYYSTQPNVGYPPAQGYNYPSQAPGTQQSYYPQNY